MIISLGSFSLASEFLICASSSFYLLTGTQVEVCSTLIWSHVMNGRKFCSLVAKAWCQFSTKNIVKKKNTAFFFFLFSLRCSRPWSRQDSLLVHLSLSCSGARGIRPTPMDLHDPFFLESILFCRSRTCQDPQLLSSPGSSQDLISLRVVKLLC